MFKTAAEEITLFMLRHKWLNLKKREIYEYAIEVLLLNGGLLLINLILSMVFRQIPVFIAFLLIFVPIRKYLGGLHLKSAELCMVCSVTFYLFAMHVNRMLYDEYAMPEMIVLILFSLICIALKPLPGKMAGQEKHNKRIANGLILVDLLLIIFFRKMNLALTPAFVFFDISALSFYLMEKARRLMETEDK